ncbi:GNAT family N-acetyltransferase [Vibrio aquimaris]|uniref:Ribosomal-protein-S5-alanine N-acetyltransferase n=1 Tax=Vibrio aquimaris TaxID=2587862 RepID=A0A5P9CPY6_9VIBR|nr:GNAT family N-acetyltransferase [Vibrio aquimaris]QFT28319.1 ribosomal-protein-S5-alanine N-acetyltransferase [Vibrio aquimaris]
MFKDFFNIDGKSYSISLLSVSDSKPITDYYKRNNKHLTQWEPRSNDNLEMQSNWQKYISSIIREYNLARFFSFVVKVDSKIVGIININDVKKKPHYSCNISYSSDLAYQGRGIIKSSIDIILEWMAKYQKIKYVTAYCMTNNKKSLKLLNSLNFQRIGLFKDYAIVNNEWKDFYLLKKELTQIF